LFLKGKTNEQIDELSKVAPMERSESLTTSLIPSRFSPVPMGVGSTLKVIGTNGGFA
jgi:hypothetical protein